MDEIAVLNMDGCKAVSIIQKSSAILYLFSICRTVVKPVF